MNGAAAEWHRDESRGASCRCCFHPKEMIVGVCALCLNERLLVLASKQNVAPKKVLPNIFALTTLLNRLDIKHHKFQQPDHMISSSTSPEDSFISIKFENNGVASWDKGKKIPQISQNQQSEIKSWEEGLDKSKTIKSMVEHAKPRSTLRWRRRIGHLLQVMRWKRSSKGNMCHGGTKIEGAKAKYGWIRSLTKRRTKE